MGVKPAAAEDADSKAGSIWQLQEHALFCGALSDVLQHACSRVGSASY
jgi:hypothetical protein